MEVYQIIAYATLSEFQCDAERSKPLFQTVMNIVFCKTDVALQSFPCQFRNHCLYGLPVIATHPEFAREFRRTVLASGQQTQRTRANVISFRVQASTSSLFSDVLITGRSLARSASSISCAISAWPFRKSRALSLP